MKMLTAGVLACGLALFAQQYPTGERKYLPVAVENGLRPVTVSAMEIERELHYPGVIHLKGSVEVRMPVCVSTGPDQTHTCDGYIVLRADEVDFHEDSGQADARGHVTMTREKSH